MNQENLEKKIKKHIYGKPQTLKVTFPAGLGETAMNEVKSILSHLWFPQKYTSECVLLKNEIRINTIHISAITELLMRSQCLTDVRLIIFEGKAAGKSEFEKKCRDIHWDFYINRTIVVKIKVDSVSSRAFHETALRMILTNVIKDHVKEVVSGDDTEETTCIYADLYKNRLTISISLAGNPLYKRGYRGTLSKSAPLREDAAACCLRKSLEFARKNDVNFSPHTVLIPFSGTGTFAFEYMLTHFQFSPVLLNREYALQKISFFRPENFNFLLKKAKNACLFPQSSSTALRFYCIDNSTAANTALAENLTKFKIAVTNNGFNFSDAMFKLHEGDMTKTKLNLSENFGNIFIPLNPPYGIRLSKNTDTVVLYKNIAETINELSQITKKEKANILGFILCPNKETWSAFCSHLASTKIETYHFTQGGMDIRVCQFFINSTILLNQK